MKKEFGLQIVIAVLILCLSVNITYGQNIHVTAVIDNRSIGATHIAKSFEARLKTALKTAGIYSGGDEGVYLVGELIPVSEETVETGMRNIKIKNYELSLRLEQPMLNLQFGHTIIPLKGTGYEASKTAMDAIQHMDPSSVEIQGFISGALKKAEEYYATHIDAIIDKANILSQSGQYDEAIALLWACPNSPTFHLKVYQALNKIYLSKQNHDCSMFMKQAENAYFLKNYEEMKHFLNLIDSDSQCAASAKALAKKAGMEIRNDEKEALAQEERERERENNIEKQRILSISRIAEEYLKTHRIAYHYFCW